MDLDNVKNIEKAFHERFRDGEGPLDPIRVQEFRRLNLQPCYTTGCDKHADNKMAFLELILQDGGWDGKYILDYACGNGVWSTYFALTGAARIVGFDLAETGIRRGTDRLRAQGLDDKVKLLVMDACQLDFPDNEFEMVIGVGVLHHVSKYPGIFEELYRVMKPGAKAYFLEGLADFPLFKLWWKMKGQVDAGDIPIFAKEIRAKTHMFSNVDITGDTFIFSLKRLLCRPSMGWVTRTILRMCKAVDTALFKICPPLRAWGSFSYIVLTK